MESGNISTILNTSTDASLVLNASGKRSLQVYDILIPVLGVLIIAMNLVVVVSSGLILKGAKAQPRTTYLFLGNMGMADMVTGVAVLFGQYFPREYRNSFICILQLGMIVSSTMASIWSVALIAVDRFLFIVYGIQYRSWIYPNRARWLILATWLIGFLVGFLPVMGWSGANDNGKVCWYIRQYPPALILLTSVVGGVPIFLVIILYSIILYHAIRKVIQLRRADRRDADVHKNDAIRVNRTGGKQENSPSKWKAVKIVLLTTGSFVITWVPYFFACSMYVFCVWGNARTECRSLEVAIAAPLAILGFVNSLLNPVIYAWWHTGFRGLVAKMMCRKRKLDRNGESNTGTKSMTKSSFISLISLSGSMVNHLASAREEVVERPLEDIDLRQ